MISFLIYDCLMTILFGGILVSIIPFLVQMRSTEGDNKQGTRLRGSTNDVEQLRELSGDPCSLRLFLQ
jgi:hypothetical protein